jgi:Lon protease-like protein
MKLSFLPGKLLLQPADDGSLRITVNGEEIFRTRSQRAAVAKFRALRQEMEQRFPPQELSMEQKAEASKRIMADYLVQHNSLGGRKKKTTARSTRTFGG